MRLPLRKSISVWALLAAAVLFHLQLFPSTGIFLKFLGAALLNAFLVHVFLVALFLEAAFNRVPRFLMVVPIFAYGDTILPTLIKTAFLRRKSPSKEPST
jgi:hypothetical protein